ncbi:hypothetical protein KRR40_32925 [Niabella defluvii]|nr:hypothetical protein KRR40_32925 [Niabella sp. I65]
MEHGYTILFGQSHDSITKEQTVMEAMVKQRIDGLLISLSKETNKYNHLVALKNTIYPWYILTGCRRLKERARYSAAFTKEPNK